MIIKLYTVLRLLRNRCNTREYRFVVVDTISVWFVNRTLRYAFGAHARCVLMTDMRRRSDYLVPECRTCPFLRAFKWLKFQLSGDSGLLEPKIGLAAAEVFDTGLGLVRDFCYVLFCFFPPSHIRVSVECSVWIWKEKCPICAGDLSPPPRLRDRKAIRPWSFARFLLWIMDAKLLLLCSDTP